MELTKLQIQKLIALERAYIDYTNITRTPEEARCGILISTDTIGSLVDRAQDIQASPACRALEEFLRALSDQEFRELQAIMLIGDGYYEPRDFGRACDETGLTPDRELDVSYLIGKMGNNYFPNGFRKLTDAGVIR